MLFKNLLPLLSFVFNIVYVQVSKYGLLLLPEDVSNSSWNRYRHIC